MDTTLISFRRDDRTTFICSSITIRIIGASRRLVFLSKEDEATLKHRELVVEGEEGRGRRRTGDYRCKIDGKMKVFE